MSYRQWEIDPDELSDNQKQGLAYWEALPRQVGIDVPLSTDFDLLGLPSASLPTTHVVDVLNDGNDFRFRFWGSGFRDFLGYDGTGISTEELKPADIAEPVRDAFRGVYRERRSVAVLSEFERTVAHARMDFQRIVRLPLANEIGEIKQIASLVEFLIDDHTAQKIVEQAEKDRTSDG